MQLPIDNLNICLVGCVSSGKSTILNTMFCEDLTQTKIKRTTMIPCIFIESIDKCSSIEHINNEISIINNKLIKKSETSKTDSDDYTPLIFQVGKLDIERNNSSKLLTIFDIPGLNDARTKNIYYNYLQETFSVFNIIIFMYIFYKKYRKSAII